MVTNNQALKKSDSELSCSDRGPQNWFACLLKQQQQKQKHVGIASSLQTLSFFFVIAQLQVLTMHAKLNCVLKCRHVVFCFRMTGFFFDVKAECVPMLMDGGGVGGGRFITHVER